MPGLFASQIVGMVGLVGNLRSVRIPRKWERPGVYFHIA